MRNYPIILIPQSIQRAQSVNPPVPVFTETAPLKPSSPPEIYDRKVLIRWMTFGFVASLVLAFFNIWLGITAITLSAFIVAYLAWSMNQSFPQRKRDYDDQVRKYPKLLQAYQQAKREYEQQVRNILTPENVASYQKLELLRILRQTKTHDRGNSKAQVGFSEAKFYAYLTHYFKDKVKRGLTLNIPNFKYHYSPDFVYIDKAVNLYIDIEIDEPYAYNSKVPTHFIGASKDTNRNNFFLNRNWLVIRFSEEQVVRYPQSCCKAIAKVIANVLGDNLYLSQFAMVVDLEPMKQWTESEALYMADRNYRQTYLIN